MIGFFANLFGYVLNFIYNFVNNYGLAIILFSIFLKLIMLPLSIKQQKTMKKSSALQEKVKEIQFKYKNDPEKMNQEVMRLYKDEHMSPFSGCLSSIVQIIILLSVFYLVSSPLTYMKHLDKEMIEVDKNIESSEEGNNSESIDLAENNDNAENKEKISVIELYKRKLKEESSNQRYPEIAIINKYGNDDNRVNLNMNFLGLDLSKVLTENFKDWKVYIIPLLYVISSVISLKITNSAQKNMMNKKREDNSVVVENNEDKSLVKKEEENPMEQASKSMSLFMPIMSLSIAIIAPLGLALYWLVNNILMIIERLVLNKLLNREENQNG